MEAVQIVHNIEHRKMYTCAGHDFFFLDTTNVKHILPLIVKTKDQKEHKITLFITDNAQKNEIDDAVEYIKCTYGENFSGLEKKELTPVEEFIKKEK